ncbi:MAG: hypothetical protein HYT64_01220 [Candidatus Yanofskybacteria bacterium]|nr:hypothetical protein [Candidatus Yanofskybacteria bacterium]
MKRKKSTKKGVDKNLEVGALLEDFDSKFDLIAEQTVQIPDIKEKVYSLAQNMEIVKMDLEFIKNSFKKKVDIDEFAALEKRVSLIERRINR